MRIAVIFEGRADSRYGVFNAVVQRVRHLCDVMRDEAVIDVYMLHLDHNRLARRLRGERAAEVPAVIHADGIEIAVVRGELTLLDALRRRLGLRPAAYERWCRSIAGRFADYDVLSVHDLLPALLARAVAKPYCVTWHGASINTTPWRDSWTRRLTVECLADAWCNCTVSDAMGEVARRLCPTARVTTLHNGADERFVPLEAERRRTLRAERGVADADIVMTFVGRHDEDKKVWLLPDIYKRVCELLPERRVVFWSIGDGPLLEQLQRALPACGDIKYWGKRPADELPCLLGCADVMVLPSRMEGLPLVAAEALAAGCHVVGSRVGGTPEVIGVDNTFPLDEHFVEHVAARIAAMARGEVTQCLPPAINWDATARLERTLLLSL